MRSTLIFNAQTSVLPAVPEAGLTASTGGQVLPQIKPTPPSSQKNKYSLNTLQGLTPF